jgi:hypothetical protein
MNKIDFFKLQAKNLHRDYKAGTPTKHFPIDYRRILYDLYEQETDVKKFTLMKAQHLIALMIGFDKWADLLKTSEEELEKRRLWLEKTTKDAFPQNDSAEENYSKDVEEVECLHCGERFPMNKEKHAPNCNGDVWDLVPVK